MVWIPVVIKEVGRQGLNDDKENSGQRDNEEADKQAKYDERENSTSMIETL